MQYLMASAMCRALAPESRSDMCPEGGLTGGILPSAEAPMPCMQEPHLEHAMPGCSRQAQCKLGVRTSWLRSRG